MSQKIVQRPSLQILEKLLDLDADQEVRDAGQEVRDVNQGKDFFRTFCFVFTLGLLLSLVFVSVRSAVIHSGTIYS